MFEFLLLLGIAVAVSQPAIVAGIGGSNITVELAHLVSYALTDTSNKNRVLQLAPVSEEQQKALKEILNINLQGYHHTIDMFAIRHIIRKHGDRATEASRGQLLIEPIDFLKIPLIIASPDTINISTEKTGTGKPAFEYKKQIDDCMYFIQEVRTGRKQLAATTLYKRKATR